MGALCNRVSGVCSCFATVEYILNMLEFALFFGDVQNKKNIKYFRKDNLNTKV